MEHRIALSHASGMIAEAILEGLSESGITSDSLVLLDTELNVGKRLPYGDGYLKIQDQYQFDFSGCALLLLSETDSELESVAIEQGCLLLGHTLESESAALFMASARDQPDISYTESRFRLAGAEASSLLPVLTELDQLAKIEHINVTFLRSAEFHGKAGVEELASQTISLLNSQSVEPSIYTSQIAFNLLPAAVDPNIENDIRQFLGNNSCSIAMQSVNVPVFHGLVMAVQLRFASAVNLDDSGRQLAGLDKLTVSKATGGPISDSNQSFSCTVSQLEQVPDQPSNLQFWIITDPLRYGLANNYVNVTDFLLKSLL